MHMQGHIYFCLYFFKKSPNSNSNFLDLKVMPSGVVFCARMTSTCAPIYWRVHCDAIAVLVHFGIVFC